MKDLDFALGKFFPLSQLHFNWTISSWCCYCWWKHRQTSFVCVENVRSMVVFFSFLFTCAGLCWAVLLSTMKKKSLFFVKSAVQTNKTVSVTWNLFQFRHTEHALEDPLPLSIPFKWQMPKDAHTVTVYGIWKIICAAQDELIWTWKWINCSLGPRGEGNLKLLWKTKRFKLEAEDAVALLLSIIDCFW